MSHREPIIRWGIIGAGRIAKTFATDINHAPHASLNAIAARQPAPAQVFADEFSIAQAYGSYAELFADPNVDAV